MRVASGLSWVPAAERGQVVAWLGRSIHRWHLRDVPRPLPRRAPALPPEGASRRGRHRRPSTGSLRSGV